MKTTRGPLRSSPLRLSRLSVVRGMPWFMLLLRTYSKGPSSNTLLKTACAKPEAPSKTQRQEL